MQQSDPKMYFRVRGTMICISWCQQTRLFTKENPNLMILKSDQTNLTVLMNKEDFLSRDLLGDMPVYPIRINPMRSISKSMDDYCARLQKANDYIRYLESGAEIIHTLLLMLLIGWIRMG